MVDYLVHPHAICESARIGSGTQIRAFAHVFEGAVIGRDSVICGHTLVEGGAVVGDRVTVESGVQLWNGVLLEDDVFIGPNVTFANDRSSRGDGDSSEVVSTRICKRASVGANATILGGLTIGQNAAIGAGAVVTRSVPPNAVVAGNPARIHGYADSLRREEREEPGRTDRASAPEVEGIRPTRVPKVTLHRLPLNRDMRGSLVAGEFHSEIPFEPKRYFLVFDVPSSEIRGEHAHRRCHLFLTCVAGDCSLAVDDGERREEFRLDHPTLGVHLPPMVWSTQYRHSSDAILLVLASEHYDPDDYIRDYQEFLDELKPGGGSSTGC